MQDRDVESNQASLVGQLQEQTNKALFGVHLWKGLGLPVLLAISGFVISSGNSRLFSIDDRWHIFLGVIPVWTVVHVVLAFCFKPLEQSEAAAILEKLRLLNIHPIGHAQTMGNKMFKYGLLMGYLYSLYACSRKSSPPQLRAATEKYYEACGQGHVLPCSRGLAYLEFTIMLAMVTAFLAFTGLALMGRIEGGHGYSGADLVFLQSLILAAYIIFFCEKVRELSLLEALAKVLSPPHE